MYFTMIQIVSIILSELNNNRDKNMSQLLYFGLGITAISIH